MKQAQEMTTRTKMIWEVALSNNLEFPESLYLPEEISESPPGGIKREGSWKETLPQNSNQILIEPDLPPLHLCGGYQSQYLATESPKNSKTKAKRTSSGEK